MAVSTMVGTAKKTMQFAIFVFVEIHETNWEVICKVVIVTKILHFYENFFRFTKKFLPIL